MTTIPDFRVLALLLVLLRQAPPRRRSTHLVDVPLPRYDLTEEGLALLASAGDQEAFNELVVLLEPALQSFARRELSSTVRSMHPTSDLVQEVLLALVRGIKKFNPNGEGSLRKYVMGIAYNKRANVLRKYYLEKSRAKEAEQVARFLTSLKGSDDPCRLVLQGEVHDLVSAEIACLPDAQREAAELVLLKGLSNKEAGLVLDLTGCAVRQRVNRACTQLEKRLRGLEG